MPGEPHNAPDSSMNARARRLLLVGLGGAAGSLVRHGVVSTSLNPTISVFVLNITGSLALGVLTGWLQHNHAPQLGTGDRFQSRWSSLLGFGFCGGLTTFSTHMVDVAQRLNSSSTSSAVVSLLGTTIVAVAAAAAGYQAARRSFEPRQPAPSGPGR